MKNTQKYLKLLSNTFPTARKAASEIINLSANLNLPKGTEHFISDIHGEYGAFNARHSKAEEFYGQVVRLFGETIMILNINKAILSSLFEAKRLELMYKPVSAEAFETGCLPKRGRLRPTMKFILC